MRTIIVLSPLVFFSELVPADPTYTGYWQAEVCAYLPAGWDADGLASADPRLGIYTCTCASAAVPSPTFPANIAVLMPEADV